MSLARGAAAIAGKADGRINAPLNPCRLRAGWIPRASCPIKPNWSPRPGSKVWPAALGSEPTFPNGEPTCAGGIQSASRLSLFQSGRSARSSTMAGHFPRWLSTADTYTGGPRRWRTHGIRKPGSMPRYGEQPDRRDQPCSSNAASAAPLIAVARIWGRTRSEAGRNRASATGTAPPARPGHFLSRLATFAARNSSPTKLRCSSPCIQSGSAYLDVLSGTPRTAVGIRT